ncbi:hypothetical protein [Pontibacter indicus]|uniref:SpoIIAA-like n=1 Tax=Pontibacter indicus TaxID=1317125 RepID=A0A1R3XNE1_9BACT|nr:hypothetical protein [Pontibacter indicus]SIT93441.1 hypothetical protein SAMN05444128_2978 [Pontibacter indicus]
MTKTQKLTKANGDIFLEYTRMPDNAYIYAHWIGRQYLDTVQKGGAAYLDLMREKPCPKLLNSHEELVGPWDIATDWISNEWMPLAISLGLRYMPQVLAKGVYGQMSFHQLHQRIGDMLEIKMFETEAEAREWLHSLP